MIQFQCGCQSHGPITRENMETLEMLDYDVEGFVVCKIHRSRRRGWRSLPTSSSGLQRPDFTLAKLTPLELEGCLLFGEGCPEILLSVGEKSYPPMNEQGETDAELFWYAMQRERKSGRGKLPANNFTLKPSLSGRKLLERGRLIQERR